jgi:hypothetical protein
VSKENLNPNAQSTSTDVVVNIEVETPVVTTPVLNKTLGNLLKTSSSNTNQSNSGIESI